MIKRMRICIYYDGRQQTTTHTNKQTKKAQLIIVELTSLLKKIDLE